MKKYVVHCTWTAYGNYYVYADSEEEAVKKVEEEELEYPTDYYYGDDFNIEYAERIE